MTREDRPHAFRPRAITDMRLRSVHDARTDRTVDHEPHYRDQECPSGVTHYRATARGSDVCDVCGGSRTVSQHMTSKAWGPLPDSLWI